MERLRKLRNERNLTTTELGNLFGFSNATITNYELGNRTPNNDTLKRFADFFNVSVDYLLERTDNPSPISQSESENKKTPSDKGERKGVWIPVYGRIAAGIPISAIEDIIDEEEISEEMLKHGEYIALQIKGDSMEPRISNGDTVIIRLQETIETGEVAAVFVNGNDVTLKRIKKEDNGIWLIGNNPAFQPIFYSKKQCEELPVRILGKMVELRGKGNF